MPDEFDVLERVIDLTSWSRPTFEVRWLIDYGTATLSIGCQIIETGTEPTPHMTKILQLQSRSSGESPQVMGFIRPSSQIPFDVTHFRWGHDLISLLDDHRRPILEENACIVERLKIALFPTPDKNISRDTVQRTLDDTKIPEMSPECLLQIHLRSIREAAMNATVKAYARSWNREEIEAMETIVFFTVPEITNEGTVQVFQQAFEAAGYGQTAALSEGESAGVWASFQLLSAQPNPDVHTANVANDSEILVADAGGLTLNVSTYQCKGFAHNGAQVHVTPTGRKAGSSCGSEIITLKCFAYVRQCCEQEYGSFEDCCADLGYSPGAFYREVAKYFEGYKPTFLREAYRHIVVCSKTDGVSEITFKITRQHMEQWFDEALRSIIRVIEKVRRPSTETILLCGGFFRSLYLTDALKQIYEPLKISLPDLTTDRQGKSDPSVVYGGMARSVLLEHPVHEDLYFGFAQSETYDKERHKELQQRSKLITYCQYTEEKIVEDRWRTLLKPGDLVSSGGRFEEEDIYQQYHLSMKEPFIAKQIYTTTTEIKDGENMLRLVGRQWRVRSDLDEWGSETKKYIDKDVLRHYKKVWPNSGEKEEKYLRYEVYARLKVRRKSAKKSDFEISWDIAPPGFDPWKDGSEDFHAPQVEALTAVGRSTLHNSMHASFIRRDAPIFVDSKSVGFDRQPPIVIPDPRYPTIRNHGSDAESDYGYTTKPSRSQQGSKRISQASRQKTTKNKRPRVKLTQKMKA